MKHFFFAVIGVLLAFLPASAQKKYSVYGVGFYNQENLFDTCHDEGKRDYDFLPTGSYKWNAMKYNHKLNNMSRALADMGTDVLPNIGCAIIGLAEVENSKALDDLIAQPALSARNYQYVHIEGPDRRGIDCALLYNPSLFSVKNTRLVPYVQKLKKDSAFYTRGFLTVSGTLADENVAVIVCHLPSRFSESFYRELGTEQVKAIKDSLLNDDPNCKVFVMGDMNDDPIDKSMAGILKGKGNIKDVNEGDMYNPWYNILVKEGVGTLLYQGSWNLFDQILVTPNLLNKDDKKDFSSLKFWKNQIFKRDYLFQTEGKYKGSPKRTTAGGVWLDGYSDHLPVVIYLVKEQ
ncbi:endonuclease/exonuclease/phosphatase family protein [Hoylesella nanceiensis]|uniref:endonuclease/exonuclease/phosphatase family protein n=1 Tax=Hoylesella nanceiensis TaxID=425941 RepID=UPI0003781709|nr:endonuclease/exonuclease/phosphatase family protein [Hoylesella nanceiensis]